MNFETGAFAPSFASFLQERSHILTFLNGENTGKTPKAHEKMDWSANKDRKILLLAVKGSQIQLPWTVIQGNCI
ncbi:MAG TPA: hypothetical protein DCS88_08235 [Alphaproteobacteria bacterium]|nr:hypothetical protein [Alphaproteobacteria bacterium]